MADKVAGLLFKISADTKALRQGFKQTQKSVSVLQKSFAALGPIIAGAFSARAIAGFTKEVVKLAGQAEGVIEAFNRLPESEKLIKDLTRATRGTVSQLQLMKYAVQAKNFKIPLQQLATYFEFATKRAAQTGESVDYLVNSLITGIGRKSVLVMDNLGISAVELQEEVKKIGDFGIAAGNIIERELGNMGDVSKTTAQDVQTLAATWTNVKIEIGKAITETSIFSETLSKITAELTEANWERTINDIIGGFEGWRDTLISFNPVLLSTLGLLNALREGVDLSKAGKKSPAQGQTFENMLLAAAARATGGQLSPQTPKGKGFGVPSPKPISGIKGQVIPGYQPYSKISSIGFGGFDLSNYIKQVEDRVNNLNRMVNETLKPAMVELGIVVQQTFMQALDSLSQFTEQLFAGTLNLEGGFNKILAAFGKFMAQMGKMIAAYGVAMLAFKMANLNPIAAIIAGAALVAIGSAISGLASGGPAGVGGSGGAGYTGKYTGGMAAIPVYGKLQGRDIAIASQRGEEFMNQTT